MENIDLQFLNLRQAITHHIGNKHNGDEIIVSEMASTIKPESMDHLIQYFFKPIPWAEYFTFGEDEASRSLNKVYPEIKEMFENDDHWIKNSKAIAHHLFECGDHPQINPGAFNVVMFDHLSYDDESMSAIGLYKSTSKIPFIQMNQKERNYELRHHMGFDLKGLDQACLILNTDEEEGYRVFVFDRTGHTSDALYWKKHFLDVKECDSEFHKTTAYMNLAKNFLNERMDEDFDVSRVDKIDLLNRSANYFRDKEQFVKQDFEEEVFADESVIESFRTFNDQVGVKNKLVLEDRFDISDPAVKRSAKDFKSILKLDKNFHIYIHGNRSMIQKGVDDNGRKFYKVFYDVES